MRTIRYILQKEFIQIFRNRMMLPIIFGMPVIQLLILAHVATYDLKNIRTIIIDNDNSSDSRELIGKFKGSPFYRIIAFYDNYAAAELAMDRGDADLIIEIPPDFEKDLTSEKEATIGLGINAINGASAGLMNAYTIAIIQDFNIKLVTKLIFRDIKQPVQVEYAYWYNPKLDYKAYMVPGILVVLVTLIGMFLSGINVVREKEIGTIEQINVTPILKYQFIAGKLIPFWIIAIFELAFGLVIAKLFFDVPIVGSIGLIFFVASLYLITVLGLGLIVSTLSETIQQSMFVTWFLMVIFILMSGLFTTVDSMPEWAKFINHINPVYYFIKIIRMIMLKGSGFQEIMNPLFALIAYGFIALSLAVWRYRKVS